MRNLSLTAKKGQVSSLAPAILALVFAGIVLVFGIIMSESLRDTQTGQETGTVSANGTLTITGTRTSAVPCTVVVLVFTPQRVYNDTDGNQTLY